MQDIISCRPNAGFMSRKIRKLKPATSLGGDAPSSFLRQKLGQTERMTRSDSVRMLVAHGFCNKRAPTKGHLAPPLLPACSELQTRAVKRRQFLEAHVPGLWVQHTG